MSKPRAFKFLVLADDTLESDKAAIFAARRAARTHGRVTVLAVIEPARFHHWLGVGHEMARDARADAESRLKRKAELIAEHDGGIVEYVIHEGALRDSLAHVVDADLQIRLLCVGAAPGRDPGPIVSALARGGQGVFGVRPVPVAVLPAELSSEGIAAIT